MKKENRTLLKKELLFIYLELFTFRFYHDYEYYVSNNCRDFILKCIRRFDFYEDFRSYCLSTSTFLSCKEFLFVHKFLKYLEIVDKIL